MNIGLRLRTLREAAGLTLDDLSRTTGIASSNLSQIETGRTDPRWSTIARILDGLDADPADLAPGGMAALVLPGSTVTSVAGRDPWARLRRKAERGEDVSEEARVLAANTRRRAAS